MNNFKIPRGHEHNNKNNSQPLIQWNSEKINLYSMSSIFICVFVMYAEQERKKEKTKVKSH